MKPNHFKNLNEIRAEIDRGLYDAAEIRLAHIQTQISSELSIEFLKGYLAFCRGQFGVALAICEKLNINHGKADDVAVLEALSKLNLGNPRGAWRTLGDIQDPLKKYNTLLQMGHYFVERRILVVAKEIYKKALDLIPQGKEAATNLGNIYLEEGQAHEAQDILNAIGRLDPTYAPALMSLVVAQEAIGAIEPGLQTMDMLRKQNIQTEQLDWIEAKLLYQKGELEIAKKKTEKLLKNNSEDFRYWQTLAVITSALGGPRSALSFIDRAIGLNPESASAKLDKAIFLLELHRYSEAWPLYAERWKLPGLCREIEQLGLPVLLTPQPGNRIIIWADQGLGDQLLYGRLIRLAKKDLQDLVVLTDARILNLFKRSLPEVEFKTIDKFQHQDRFDGITPLSELPRLYIQSDKDLNSIPQLDLVPFRASLADQDLPGEGLGKNRVLGLSWKSTNQKVSNRKNVDLLKMIEIVKELKSQNISKVKSLQFLSEQQELDLLADHFMSDFVPDGGDDIYNDLEKFANLVRSCTHILTVSNSVAHFAGSLGVDTMLIMPYPNQTHWYWANQGGQSIWYKSLKLISVTDPNINEKLKRWISNA